LKYNFILGYTTYTGETMKRLQTYRIAAMTVLSAFLFTACSGLGQGFAEYSSVRIDIDGQPNGWSPTNSWISIDEIELIVPVNPETKNDCKQGGWEQYGFKNQGQCVRFIETGKDSR